MSSVTIHHIATELKDDDARLNYFLSCLKFIETNIEEPSCGRLCKSLSSEIVQKFNHSPLFRSDIRAFEIWEYFAKYSYNLGYGKVMEQIYALGLFKDLVEYYEKWAIFALKSGDMGKVAQIEGFAMANCSDKKRIAEIFKNWIVVDETENILRNLRCSEKSEVAAVPVLKKPLSVVNEDSSESRGISQIVSNASNVSIRTAIQPSEEEHGNKNAVKSDDIDATFVIERNKAPQANYSFTSHLIKNEVDLYGQTLPLSQEPQHFPTIKESPKVFETEKDFSIFRDVDENDVRGVVRPYIKGSPAAFESPIAKRSKSKNDLADSGDFDKIFSSMALESKFASPEAEKMFVPMIADEKTVAGYGKCGSTMASTPKKNDTNRPMFEVSPTQTFAFPKKKQSGPVVSKPFVFSAIPVVEKPNTKQGTGKMDQDASVPEDDDNIFETTRDYSICGEAKVTSAVNPWGEKERLKILSRAPPMVEQHEFLNKKCPPFRLQSEVQMGGEPYKIVKLIGRGGFAKVFQAVKEDSSIVAIKLEMPACPWEVYMCKIAVQRIDEVIQPFVMNIHDAYIFSNASAIVYDYHSKGTLLDLVNVFKKDNNCINGQVVSYIGTQIASVMGYLHKAQIIHSDVKPDNFVVLNYLSVDEPKKIYDKPFIKLIDWGRGIDMSFFKGQNFKGRAGTEGFDCTEMVEGRPWSYHPDYFGYVGTMHVLIFGKYMKTSYNRITKRYVISEFIKTRYPLSHIWKRIFDDFLNIPDCENFPDWFSVVKDVRDALDDYIEEDLHSWEKSFNQCNEYLRSIN